LTFSNTLSNTVGYTLTPGLSNSGSLTMANTSSSTSSPSQIIVTSGSHSITAPVTIANGNLDITATGNSILAISGNIADDSNSGSILANERSLTLTSADGTGELILSGTNNYAGGTFVQSGTLILTNNEALAEGSSLTIGDASAFTSDGGATSAVAASSGLNEPLAAFPAITPVPEPGTLVLVVAGVVAGLATWRRRRNRAT
jgi:autotransporter-associated beta strand protein